MRKPVGFVSISKITLADGSSLPLQQAVKYGWINPIDDCCGFKLDKDELPLGKNMLVDQCRQIIAFAMGGRSNNDHIVSFSMGTGITPPKVTDTSLESALPFSDGRYFKGIESLTYIGPFMLRVAFTLGINDGSGYNISEFGLLSGDNVLIARKVRSVAINKTTDFSPTLTWRIRF
jgi:hypothetical protein